VLFVRELRSFSFSYLYLIQAILNFSLCQKSLNCKYSYEVKTITDLVCQNQTNSKYDLYFFMILAAENLEKNVWNIILFENNDLISIAVFVCFHCT
jgi:hypothetical protein